jgi:serine protein kinase
VLYLMGPVGSGKSSLVEKLQRGLESSDPIYAIDGCPMFESRCTSSPATCERVREDARHAHRGRLCPVCRFR